MHIQTLRNPAHRHLLVLPLLLLVLAFSVNVRGTAHPQLLAALTIESDAQGQHLQGLGFIGLASPGSVVGAGEGRAVILREGELLFLTEGKGTVVAGGAQITGFAGGYSVTLHSGTLSVVALTTPVLLQSDDGGRRILPIGEQWRSVGAERSLVDAAFLPVPADFFQEQLRALEPLPRERLERGLPSPRGNFPPSPYSLLRLASAEERAQHDWAEALLGYLRTLVAQGDAPDVRSFFNDPAVREAVTSSPRSSAIFSRFLARSARSEGVAMALFPYVEDGEAWLLASLHPQFRAVAWMSPRPPALSSDVVRLRLLSLPETDRLPEGAPGFVVERWGTEMEGYIAQQGEEQNAVLRVILTKISDAISRFEHMGYPERVQRYGVVLLALAEGHEEFLPASLRADLTRLRAFGDIAVERLPAELQWAAETPSPLEEGSSSSAQRNAQYLPSPEEAEALRTSARALLGSAGAVFTVQTSIQAVAPGRVSVRAIIFSGTEGDRAYDFTLDVSDRTVHGIIVEGKELPNEVSLSAFAAWARGEE